MDLIYTDANRVEQGILLQYNLDIAFGKSENDFELKVPIEDVVLQPSGFIYIPDTQYGGIIDVISPNTSSQELTYSGRTWHGILDSKIVTPPKGYDYLILNGDANYILRTLLSQYGLTSLFEGNTGDSGIEIYGYAFPRYASWYQGVRMMLYSVGAKLDIKYSSKSQKVLISAVPLVDYSTDEEWDSSDFAMTIKKHFNPVNHLYCLGSGSLGDRFVIELFTDEYGTLQSYTKVDNPIKDSQYIRNASQKVLTGIRENCAIYNNESAQTTENYELQTKRPKNWNDPYVYTQYYTYDAYEKNYVQNEREFNETYELLSNKPLDWNWNYSEYYYKEKGSEGDDAYKNLDENYVHKDVNYVKINDMPKGWRKNYSNYYYKYSDGLSITYKPIETVKKSVHRKLKYRPSDWKSNKGNYYVHIKHYEYTYELKMLDPKDITVWRTYIVKTRSKMSAADMKKSKAKQIGKRKLVKSEFVKISDLVKNPEKYIDQRPVPDVRMSDFSSWSKSKWRPFYTQISVDKAPKYVDGKYYYKNEVLSSPDWVKDKYYAKTNLEIIPKFTSGMYYLKVQDNYAELVAGGIEQLKQYWSLDTCESSFGPDEEYYDVGDIVGATEPRTNISITSPITKKIVNIDDGELSVQYELGDDNELTNY